MREIEGAICSNLFSIEDVRSSKGVTLAVRELIDGLVANDFLIKDVIRVAPLFNSSGLWLPNKTTYKGFNVYDCALVGVRSLYLKWATSVLMRWLNKGKQYDYVICHYARNVIFAQEHISGKKKIVYIVHNTDFDSVNKSYVRKVIGQPMLILSRSHSLARRFELEYGIPVDGLALSGIEKNIIVSAPGNVYRGGELRIIVACSLIALKNTEATIGAVKKLIDKGIRTKLVILGDGPLKSSLEKLVNQLDINSSVDFLGHVNRCKVLTEMRVANLFIMPSAPETMGLAYLEAMASGCVVVGHEGWGIDGVVINGFNGYLVKSASVDNIVKSVLEYFCSNKEKVHLKSIETVRDYTKERVAKQYADTLKEFLLKN